MGLWSGPVWGLVVDGPGVVGAVPRVARSGRWGSGGGPVRSLSALNCAGSLLSCSARIASGVEVQTTTKWPDSQINTKQWRDARTVDGRERALERYWHVVSAILSNELGDGLHEKGKHPSPPYTSGPVVAFKSEWSASLTTVSVRAHSARTLGRLLV